MGRFPGAAFWHLLNPVEKKERKKSVGLKTGFAKCQRLRTRRVSHFTWLRRELDRGILSGAQCGGLGEAALRGYVVAARRILGRLCIVRRRLAPRIRVVEEHHFLNRFSPVAI